MNPCWPSRAFVPLCVAACRLPLPHQACPPVLLDQLHTAIRGFPGKRPRSRAPATPSSTRTHTRDLGTGGTVSTQTVGEVKAEMRAARDSHMPAELPRETAPIHHFQTHAARTRRVAPFSFVQVSRGTSPRYTVYMAGVHRETARPLPLRRRRSADEK